jgi:hypothetical protein
MSEENNKDKIEVDPSVSDDLLRVALDVAEQPGNLLIDALAFITKYGGTRRYSFYCSIHCGRRKNI